MLSFSILTLTTSFFLWSYYLLEVFQIKLVFVFDWFYCNEDARKENASNTKSMLPRLLNVFLFRYLRNFGMVLKRDGRHENDGYRMKGK